MQKYAELNVKTRF